MADNVFDLRAPQNPNLPVRCPTCLGAPTVTHLIGRAHFECGCQVFVEGGQVRATPCPRATVVTMVQRNQLAALVLENTALRAQLAELTGEAPAPVADTGPPPEPPAAAAD